MAEYVRVAYKDIFNDEWALEILDDTYSGTVILKTGRVVINRKKVKVMDVIRGMSLDIFLDAEQGDTTYDRFITTIGDRKFPVKLKKNNTEIIFTGFLDVDGILESFVQDRWIVKLTASDGLGYLENTLYLDPNGNPYTGTQSELIILARCLQLTGQDMNFKLFDALLLFRTNPGAYSSLNKPIIQTRIDQDRFRNTDQDQSAFNVKKVLEGILIKYGYTVWQQNNYWYVARIRDYWGEFNTLSYNEYDLDGKFQQQVITYDRNAVLGSQINGFFPHHAKANQQKRYTSALGAFKVLYTYGFVATLIENSNVLFTNSNPDIIPNWNIVGNDYTLLPSATGTTFFAQIDTQVKFSSLRPIEQLIEQLFYPYSNGSEVSADDILKVEITGNTTLKGRNINCYIQIYVTDLTDTYYLDDDGSWHDTPIKIIEIANVKGNVVNEVVADFKIEITTAGVPINGRISINIYDGLHRDILWLGVGSRQSFYTINNITINGLPNQGVTGESWTGTKTSDEVAIVDTEQKVYSGDNDSDVYIGALENNVGDNTFVWARQIPFVDQTEQWPLLYWLSFQRMEISFGNQLNFKGGIYGYLPYGRKLSIDNIDGVFMTIQMKYDTINGIMEAEHVRIYNDRKSPQNEIYVEFSLEGDNVVKPAIE